MKLKHFLRPLDASFSTPIAARTLLRSFFVVLLSLFGGFGVYLSSCFEREVSQRRGYMSAAVLEAQRFFTGHEVLLKSLSLSAVPYGLNGIALPESLPGETQWVLGQGADAWSLWLTDREFSYLHESQINLLYVKAGAAEHVERLTQSTGRQLPIDQGILSQLKALVMGEYWFNTTPILVLAQSASLYLFTLLDKRDPLGIAAHTVSAKQGGVLYPALHFARTTRLQLFLKVQGMRGGKV